MIQVLVVDDHPIVRAGVVGLLDTEPDLHVVAEAASGEAAVEYAMTHAPDVVLMDLRMPGIGGVEATRQITRGTPQVAPRVLIFTTYEDDDDLLAAIEAGASGYLLKASPAEQLTAGIRAVAAGQTVLAPSIAAQLAQAAIRPSVRTPTLTAREGEILALVAQGLSNARIAAQLYIGESTVKTHLVHVFEKLEVNDRTRAVTRALELGLLT